MCVYRGVSPTSEIQVEVGKKSGHSFWAQYREASQFIELHELFSDYWSSKKREFTVMSQSSSPTRPHTTSDRRTAGVVIGKHSGSLEVRFSANTTVRIFATAHPVS